MILSKQKLPEWQFFLLHMVNFPVVLCVFIDLSGLSMVSFVREVNYEVGF